MMKILITGATGLVGKELTQLLISNGYKVHYLTTSKDKLENQESYKGFYWNPQEGVIDEACVIDVTCVFHLAGASISKRWTTAYKQEILDSRVLSTNLLFSLLKRNQHNVQHFISASAIGVYPDSLVKVYNEDEPEVDKSFLGEVVSKWENAVKQIEQMGIATALVRTGIVLSDKGGALPEMAAPIKLGAGSAFGSGKQIQSWIHIGDLVNIYFYILQHKLKGIYNAVAPHAVSNDDLMRSIAQVLHKPYFMPKVPRFVMSAVLGEMHMLLFTSQHVSAKKLIDNDYEFVYSLLDDALKDTLL